MTTIIIIAIVSLVVAVVSAFFADDYDIFGFLTFLFGAICVVAFTILLASAFHYHGAKYKAEIINREFGTEYTQDEIFYAHDVIEIIQQIKRQRIELDIKADKE